MQNKDEIENAEEYVVWVTGGGDNTESEGGDEDEESSGPCEECAALDGQVFHYLEIPSTHENCKCGTIPFRYHVRFERLEAEIEKLEKKIEREKMELKRKRIISSYYGQKDGVHPNGHTGTDFRTPIGTAIQSPVDGVVSRNDYGSGNGNRIAIVDKNGIEHHFYHMNEQSNLQVGTQVEVGDVIGYSGNTGRSTGPHVHYEVRDLYAGNTLDQQRMSPSQEIVDYLVESFYSAIYGL